MSMCKWATEIVAEGAFVQDGKCPKGVCPREGGAPIQWAFVRTPKHQNSSTNSSTEGYYALVKLSRMLSKQVSAYGWMYLASDTSFCGQTNTPVIMPP